MEASVNKLGELCSSASALIELQSAGEWKCLDRHSGREKTKPKHIPYTDTSLQQLAQASTETPAPADVLLLLEQIHEVVVVDLLAKQTLVS